MSQYVLFLVGGLLVVIAAWVPLFLRDMPLSLPMIALGIGLAVGATGAMENTLAAYSVTAQAVAQFALLVAVLGAGLRLDRPFSLAGWASAWRLLFIVMPLTIAAAAAIARGLLGFPLGLAVLVGAILSPTDPVLAAGVQAGPPGVGEEGEAKFALTAEAGVNDGLAFPFVHLGLLLAASPALDARALIDWFAVDLVWNIAGGIGIGVAVAALLVGVNRLLPAEWQLSSSNSGIVSVGLALIAYGAAESVGANGFVAVFCEAVAIRNFVRRYEYSRRLTLSAEQLERVAMVVLMVFLGLSLAHGLIAQVGWREIVFVVLLVAIRPILVAAAFVRSGHDRRTQIGLGYFGIRGIASLFYASFLINQLGIDPDRRLTAIVGLAVLVSIVLYGTTTDAVAKRLLHHPPEETTD